MIDLALTIALPLLGVALLAAVLHFLTGERVHWRPLATALACVFLYWVAVVGGSEVQGMIPALADLKWNWVGKIVAIAATLLLIRFMPGVDARSAGLTWRQRAGSLVPVLVCTALMCALAWGAEAYAADGSDLSPERLLYQATMPGIDEELFFRGLLLALLLKVFDERWSLAGAPIGPAAAAITFFFAAGHGLAVVDGTLHFDGFAFAITGALGFGLLWLRQRTGSLVAPVLVHNLLNVGSSFF